MENNFSISSENIQISGKYYIIILNKNLFNESLKELENVEDYINNDDKNNNNNSCSAKRTSLEENNVKEKELNFDKNKTLVKDKKLSQKSNNSKNVNSFTKKNKVNYFLLNLFLF